VDLGAFASGHLPSVSPQNPLEPKSVLFVQLVATKALFLILFKEVLSLIPVVIIDMHRVANCA